MRSFNAIIGRRSLFPSTHKVAPIPGVPKPKPAFKVAPIAARKNKADAAADDADKCERPLKMLRVSTCTFSYWAGGYFARLGRTRMSFFARGGLDMPPPPKPDTPADYRQWLVGKNLGGDFYVYRTSFPS